MIPLLGTEHPIIQAPMAGVSTPALAAAVSNAGGLGSLGIGASTVAQARQAITETQDLTSRPFNVNVFCHQPARRNDAREAAWIAHFAPLFAELSATPPTALQEIYTSFLANDEAFELLLAVRPAVVSFHFGLPDRDKIVALRDRGITLLATATNLAEARAIHAAGLHGIVAQGIEAGGHRGMFDPEAEDEQASTMALVRLLVSQGDLPVIAAGGIMDGAGIHAALEAGAVAAQLGTAFILCPESAASTDYRQALRHQTVKHKGGGTRLTAVLSGRPARGIVNRLISHGEAAGSPVAAAYPLAYDLAKQLQSAALKQGASDFSAFWAGQGVPLVRERPAADLVEILAYELRSLTFSADSFLPR